MRVEDAPRRTIDFYVARLEGFVLVDGPNGKVLVPPGLHIADWQFRPDAELMSFVPHFTRDWETGGGVLRKDDPGMLEFLVRRYVRVHYGDDLPDLPC